MSRILGLNLFHGDSSACLVVDGQLVAAVEEERFRRVKHWAGFPSRAIASCLDQAGLSLADITDVAVNNDPKAHVLRKVGFVVKQRPDLKLLWERIQNRKARTGVGELLAQSFPDDRFGGEIHAVEHHLAHLASAYLASPYEKAITVSVDGFGDFASTAWGLGDGESLSVEGRVFFPHSLGLFYLALTQYLGFPHYGDEYKMMGLAPYGKPKYLEQMRQIVRLEEGGGFTLNLDFFRHHRETVEYQWDACAPHTDKVYAESLVDLLGPFRRKEDSLEQHHKDMARSAQAMYEEAFFHLLNSRYEIHGVDRLALAGGCGMNSVANGRIRLNTPFKEVFIQPAAGDAGGAIGAALQVWRDRYHGKRVFRMHHALWGPSFDGAEVDEVLSKHRRAIEEAGCTVTVMQDETTLIQRVAEAIAAGRVIGWFQGRMEWGPRALGNRSILGDPGRADMKDILNHKIKRRESFRPFAPSVLREAVEEWFEMDDEVPFMMKVFQVRQEKRAMIPAVTHVDGSGRLQTVDSQSNPLYHKLISKFRDLTGTPMVLNTSFNENEPIVCRPEEALDCFLRTKMDLLALGDRVIERV
ncbi:MAG: carbamoyltransferase [Magnetococcales bacterium]|nr:carbamoyltransferase [Magnetococcales bacterium]